MNKSFRFGSLLVGLGLFIGCGAPATTPAVDSSSTDTPAYEQQMTEGATPAEEAPAAEAAPAEEAAPEVPAPEVPAPEAPAPEVPAPEAPAPEAPATPAAE